MTVRILVFLICINGSDRIVPFNADQSFRSAAEQSDSNKRASDKYYHKNSDIQYDLRSFFHIRLSSSSFPHTAPKIIATAITITKAMTSFFFIYNLRNRQFVGVPFFFSLSF